MISEFFLNIIFGLISGMLSLLPDISWSFSVSALHPFLIFVRAAGYMLPIDTILTIMSLVISFTMVRVVVALIRTIWDLLPLV